MTIAEQFPVVIETRDAPPKVIDHGNDSDRVWLSRFITWAMRNGIRVTLRPLDNGGDN